MVQGKVTSRKAPTAIGLYGSKTFIETWECIKNNKQEPSKHFRNFERGVQYEDSGANCCSIKSAAKLLGVWNFCAYTNNRFAALQMECFWGKPFQN